MALVVKDRVQETSITTGTGTFTLVGAVTGFQTFSSAIGNTNTTYYTIQGDGEWEVGIGTVGTGTLSRDTVLESSNSGALVNFSAGSKFVFCTYPAEKSVDIETAQTLTNKTISGASNTLSNIANASLTNSAITINGTSTSLGGSINVGTVTSISAGSYLTGGTITDSGTIAVDATSANTASKIVARDASGNFSAGTITASLTGDVTGNVSGSSGSCTGNSATATTSTNLSGGAVAAGGLINTKTNNANFVSANDTTLSVRGDSTYPASMTFHRAGAYAVNFGLDTDNVLKVGGWSMGSVYPMLYPTATNAQGSAPVYGCRAWVNFNGTGTVSIRASGNVSSITDLATGRYRVNFSTSMVDANYSTSGSASSSNCEAVIRLLTFQTTSCEVGIVDSNAPAFTDDSLISVQVFR